MKKALLLVVAGVVGLTWAAPTGVSGADSLNRAGTVTAVAGPVTLTRPEATPQPLKFRDTLFWRDVVETRKDGIARVLVGGTTTVTVRELSSLELRQEATADGVRYTAELISGKVRASVARMLMRPGDQVEVRTRNAVAAVRGTDFIVETVERLAPARAFGLLGVLEVAQGVSDSAVRSGDTVVVTLSGVVEVSNRLGGTGHVARVGAYQVARVSGRQDPVGFRVTAADFKVLLHGLTPPRPQEARSVDKAEAVGNKVERVAVATSAQNVRSLQSSSKVEPATPAVAATPAAPATPPAAATNHGNGQGNGDGLALGRGNSQGPAAAPATPAVAATPAVPATPATGAVAATPANAGKGKGGGNAPGRGNSGTPPGRAKK